MSALSIFVPLTKVDVENRLVYGQVAAEVVDNSGEMFDYTKSKPYFQKWSLNAEMTSGGLSKGNVRAMHGKVAAGKLTDLAFDDDKRTIECCAKVVDDNEWKKCLEGVYTGFSMGGRYAERWVEKSDNGMDIKRYAGDPAEISLVDKPCIPTATFQMIKADGVVEEAHFTTIMSEEDLEKASKQPRVPSGPKGGQFASSGGGGIGGKASSAASGDEGAAKSLADTHAGKSNKNPDSLKSNAKRMDQSADRLEAEYKSDKGGKGFADPTSPTVVATRNQSIANMRRGAEILRERAAKYEGKAEKSDAGDMKMNTAYVPTNDETLPVAQELAKAAGSPDWMDFMEAARSKLVEDHLAKADDKDSKEPKEGAEDKGDFDEDAATGPKEGEGSAVGADADDTKDAATGPKEGEGSAVGADADDTKDAGSKEGAKDGEGDEKEGGKKPPFGKDKEAAEKADGQGDLPELEQGWRAKDGSFHLKKADAIAHNDTLAKADQGEVKEPTLVEQVAELAKSAAAIAAGEIEPVAGAKEEVETTDVEKYAAFLEGGFALLKSADGGDELQKSMYTVERMARVLRDVASLQISVSKEQIREGDDSPTPGMIGVAVGQLGETLIAMAKEEVDELMLQVAANDVKAEVLDYCCPDVYYELASSTLGLEKSAVNELGKAAQSKKLSQLQKMHDQCTKMGAKCSEGMAKVDGNDEMNKMAGELGDLRKRAEGAEAQLVEIAPLLKSLQSDLEKIKAMPQPAAPRTNIVEKSDDGKGVVNTRNAVAGEAGLLEKYTPDQIADAAIRLAQTNGVTMTSRGMTPQR